MTGTFTRDFDTGFGETLTTFTGNFWAAFETTLIVFTVFAVFIGVFFDAFLTIGLAVIFFTGVLGVGFVVLVIIFFLAGTGLGVVFLLTTFLETLTLAIVFLIGFATDLVVGLATCFRTTIIFFTGLRTFTVAFLARSLVVTFFTGFITFFLVGILIKTL
ncbi:MAG: hypothetical protein LBH91_04270 [Prevotellaceae bacterium]|nr:hypothetical protein [Prevotellaceae bacterium]